MSLFESAMAAAVQLSMADRERLAVALGVRKESTRQSLPLSQFAPRPDPVAWKKAETGHAVLATGSGAAEIPAGAAAIAGIWSHLSADFASPAADSPTVATLPRSQPVVVNTDVCFALGAGVPQAVTFFQEATVEPRLATATYLALMAVAEDEHQLSRLRRFVQPYAVLSLGPMASSRAAELMLERALSNGLRPLDALIAATALAHEIPLVTLDSRPFGGITGLIVVHPY